MRKNLFVSLVVAGAVGVLWLGKSISDRKIYSLEQRIQINPFALDKNVSTEDEAPAIAWDVVDVPDGNTIRVKKGSQQLKVRFACIEAPELSHPLGVQSRDYLRGLIKNSRGKVGVDIITRDRSGLTVAEIWASQSYGGGEPSPELLQSRLAAAGMVYPYEKYRGDCKSWEAVQATSSRAKNKRLGVWSDDDQKPWDYRKSHQ